MKSLKESLFDDDLVTKDVYIYHPKTNIELEECIKKEIDRQGPDANLNLIDVSKITDMSGLFTNVKKIIRNIDISEWDVSNVEDMAGMFWYCRNFNCDLSKWNVSKVEDIHFMFINCEHFNSDLSKWNVKNVTNMNSMFEGCANFNCDLSKWDVSKVDNMRCMFVGCKSLKKIPSWYEES